MCKRAIAQIPLSGCRRTGNGENESRRVAWEGKIVESNLPRPNQRSEPVEFARVADHERTFELIIGKVGRFKG